MADAPLDPEEAARELLARAGDSQWARETVALGLRAKAEGLRRDAARLEALAGRVVSGDLTVAPNSDHIRDDMQPAVREIRHRRGRPSKSSHPFVVALEAKRSSVADWARRHKLPRSTVKGWASGEKRIPAQYARAIEKELGVPATEQFWPQGIRE